MGYGVGVGVVSGVGAAVGRGVGVVSGVGVAVGGGVDVGMLVGSGKSVACFPSSQADSRVAVTKHSSTVQAVLLCLAISSGQVNLGSRKSSLLTLGPKASARTQG